MGKILHGGSRVQADKRTQLFTRKQEFGGANVPAAKLGRSVEGVSRCVSVPGSGNGRRDVRIRCQPAERLSSWRPVAEMSRRFPRH